MAIGDLHHGPPLLRIAGRDQPGAVFAHGQGVEHGLRRRPAGIAAAQLRHPCPCLGKAAVADQIPDRAFVHRAVGRAAEQVGRRLPVGMERFQPADFGLQLLHVADAGVIAQRRFVDGAGGRRARLNLDPHAGGQAFGAGSRGGGALRRGHAGAGEQGDHRHHRRRRGAEKRSQGHRHAGFLPAAARRTIRVRLAA